jgi:GrpB-like predicted nucleotidyltransferase (UPF0157 family)
VVIANYDPSWPTIYGHERDLLAAALGDLVAGIHHIGSTSVPGMAAKPIIDIAVESREQQMPPSELFKGALREARYQQIWEDGRLTMFKKEAPRCNLHVYYADDPAIGDCLAFADYLRTHPDRARQYEELKRQLALKHPDDIGSYTGGKKAFVKKTLQLGRPRLSRP